MELKRGRVRQALQLSPTPNFVVSALVDMHPHIACIAARSGNTLQRRSCAPALKLFLQKKLRPIVKSRLAGRTSLWRRSCDPADLAYLPVASFVPCRPPCFALPPHAPDTSSPNLLFVPLPKALSAISMRAILNKLLRHKNCLGARSCRACFRFSDLLTNTRESESQIQPRGSHFARPVCTRAAVGFSAPQDAGLRREPSHDAAPMVCARGLQAEACRESARLSAPDHITVEGFVR